MSEPNVVKGTIEFFGSRCPACEKTVGPFEDAFYGELRGLDGAVMYYGRYHTHCMAQAVEDGHRLLEQQP